MNIERIDVSIPVKVRKFEIDKDALTARLRTSKKESGFSNKEIAQKLSKPLTMVEHWFRTDNCFSVPEPDVWHQLKDLIGIDTDEFDEQVMTFIEKAGEYEQRNRLYLTTGIAPTLTTGSEMLIMTNIEVIGRLDMKGNDQNKRVYSVDGISPCLLTNGGGHKEPKILVGGEDVNEDKIGHIKEWGQKGGVYSNDGVSPTLLATDYKTPKLTTDGNYDQLQVSTNDFFCGCGGMGLGFKYAGFKIAGAWDFDKYAVQSYKHNIGDHVQQTNILEMTYLDVPRAHTWTFGAPCQAFSIAGKQLGMTFKCPSCNHEEEFEGEQIIDRMTPCSKCGDDSRPKDVRGILFFEIMRLLKETQIGAPDSMPPIIMLENVKGIAKFLDVIAYEYEKRGYRMYKALYNSKFWGVPQNRERYFIVGVRNDIEKEFIFPEQQEYFVPRLSTILEKHVEENFYIDLEKSQNIIQQAQEGLRIREATKLGYKVAKEGDSVNLNQPNSKTRRGRVGDQVAQTLLAANQDLHVVESQNVERLQEEKQLRVRKLTPREYARLQGFPESFEIVVSNSQAYKQFGNAVTVNVSQAIAQRIKMFLESL